jgi:hypothetical protein
MPLVGFEHTIPVFQRAKTVHALVCEATVIGLEIIWVVGSHSSVRVPRDSWPYFTVSSSRLPLRGGPGPRIYIPLE